MFFIPDIGVMKNNEFNNNVDEPSTEGGDPSSVRINMEANSARYRSPEHEPFLSQNTINPTSVIPIGKPLYQTQAKTKTESVIKHFKTEHIVVKPNDKLVEALLKNDVKRVEDLVKSLNSVDINKRHTNFDNKTAIVIACIDDKVTASTLRTFLSCLKNRFSKIDCVDEIWYGWEPIHYSAKVADPEKLKVVVEFTDVHSLTYYSENALHILIENKKYTVNGNFLNDIINIPCCLISEMSENALECADILMKHRVDAGHSNFWNESPVCLAFKYRYYKLVEEILTKHPYIDIESCSKYEENLREFQKAMHIRPSSTDVYEEPAVTLFNYLKEGDVDSFLHFMNGNIAEYVDEVDGGGDTSTSGGTMLQLCFRKLFLEYLQCEKYYTVLVDDECSILDTPILEIFRSTGMRRLSKY